MHYERSGTETYIKLKRAQKEELKVKDNYQTSHADAQSLILYFEHIALNTLHAVILLLQAEDNLEMLYKCIFPTEFLLYKHCA